jgi:hypothetical protein
MLSVRQPATRRPSQGLGFPSLQCNVIPIDMNDVVSYEKIRGIRKKSDRAWERCGLGACHSVISLKNKQQA